MRFRRLLDHIVDHSFLEDAFK
uniref:Uncharacterized protein n=1 Tax=Arundo donax TaxID=35708 RepID=A0A0A8ZBP1_ARUDO